MRSFLAIVISTVTFLMGRYKSILGTSTEPHLEQVLDRALDKTLDKARQFLSTVIIGWIGTALFCAGVIIAVMNVASQYDEEGYVFFTATIAVGLVLAVFGGLGLFWMGSQKSASEVSVKKRQQQQQETVQAKPSSPLETAIAMLVMDFVKERESHRNNKASAPYPVANSADLEQHQPARSDLFHGLETDNISNAH